MRGLKTTTRVLEVAKGDSLTCWNRQGSVVLVRPTLSECGSHKHSWDFDDPEDERFWEAAGATFGELLSVEISESELSYFLTVEPMLILRI